MTGTYYNYILDVDPNPYAYTVTLNGFPIDDSPGNANGHFSSTRVGEYIADGDNIVAVHLSAPQPTATFFSSFSVIIRVTGNPQLFGYEWDASVPHPHPPLPFTAEKHFTTHLPHPWEWQTAPKIILDAPTKQAINAHIKRLYDALDSKNIDESVALFALRNHDHHLSIGLPVAQAKQESHDAWMERFSSPGWHMYPIDYPHLRYELIAGGRVVHVVRPDDGLPLINAAADPDGQHTGFDLFLSQVHGQWTLIR